MSVASGMASFMRATTVHQMGQRQSRAMTWVPARSRGLTVSKWDVSGENESRFGTAGGDGGIGERAAQ